MSFRRGRARWLMFTFAACVSVASRAGTGVADAEAAATVHCGQVITTSTVLATDVGPCPGNGLIVGADHIVLDLSGHRVFGTPGPGDGTAAGIRLPNRIGVTVRNGSVTDFDAGVVVNRGSRNTIVRLKVLNNIGPRGRSLNWATGLSCSARPTTKSSVTSYVTTASSMASVC